MSQKTKQSRRIQTSILNGPEKKVLVWMAGKMPSWVNSDMLTFTGSAGALMFGLGYALTPVSIQFLWLSCLGLFINWFGDSLDGTLARVRNCQRPRYGFFLDHMMDCINEVIMFVGCGLSVLMRFDIALMVLISYLLLTVYVFTSAHLKGEFKLTYAKVGPTEFRIVILIATLMFLYIKPLREYTHIFNIFGTEVDASLLDIMGAAIAVVLFVMFIISVIKDAKEYAREEPLRHNAS